VGDSGSSTLHVGVNSTLNAAGILAGIAISANLPGYDPSSPNHGTALISTRDNGFINAPIVLGTGGTLMGTGTVGPLVTNFGGTIRPGFSPGTLHIAGDYIDHAGHIDIEIGPNGSDFIDVAGNLSLDGTSIEFKFLDGFAPTAGFSYDFIDADGSVDMANVSYSFSGLQAGFQFAVSSDPNSGTLTFTARTNGIALPEPTPIALLGLAGLAAWAVRRRHLAKHLADSNPPGPHFTG
ncbi:MAG: PEP-CTERM sorting domain-containing protein, partial [Aquabacterium sp.]